MQPRGQERLTAIRAKPRVSNPPCLQSFPGAFSCEGGEPAADMASPSERHQCEFIFYFAVNRFSTRPISNTALLVCKTYEVCHPDGQDSLSSLRLQRAPASQQLCSLAEHSLILLCTLLGFQGE